MQSPKWETLTKSEKRAFIRANYAGKLSKGDDLNLICENIFHSVLPNLVEIDTVNLTPEVATLIDATIEDLPNEILLEISKDLDYNSVLKICTVNKRFSKICENRVFWMQYLRQRDYDGPLQDKTLDELRILTDYETASIDYVYSLYLNKRYELFASYVLGKDIIIEIFNELTYQNKSFEEVALVLNLNVTLDVSQDLKDLTLIYFSHGYMDFSNYDEEDINNIVMQLLSIGANPLREYLDVFIGRSDVTSAYLSRLHEYILHPDEDLPSIEELIDKFQPSLTISLLLLRESMEFEFEGYESVMNYISNNYSGSKLHIDLYWYGEIVDDMNINHVTNYLENGGFIILEAQPLDEIVDNQNSLFNRYRDQFIVES